jgi:hypothetical protein
VPLTKSHSFRDAAKILLLAVGITLGILGLLSLKNGAKNDAEVPKVREGAFAGKLIEPNDLLIPSLMLNLPCYEEREADWTRELARSLGGETELAVESGRMDVATSRYAIEVDRIEKFHEGIGQAVHYGKSSSKIPVLAIFSNSRLVDADKLALIESSAQDAGVKLVLLIGMGDDGNGCRLVR